MAEELQNRKRSVITGETWEKAFQGVDKTSKAFHDLVDEFTEWVSKYHEFSDFQERDFTEYLKNLTSIQDHWEEINDWVERNSNTLNTYAGSLSTIQSTFQSILNEAGGVRGRIREGVNLFRQLNRIASEGISLSQQEGGISENALKALDRRKVKADVLYKLQLRQLGVLDSAGKIDEDLASSRLEASQKQIEKDQATLNRLNKLKADGVKIDNQQIRYLLDKIKYEELVVETVGKENRLAKESLDSILDRQKELFRMQSKGRGPVEDLGRNAFGNRKVNIVTKVLKKLQFQEEAEDIQRAHGEWKTNRVVARQAVDEAEKRKSVSDRAAQLAKEHHENLSKEQPQRLEEFAFRKLAKQRELAGIQEEKGRLEKVYSTGRHENGRFASEEEIDKAFWRWNELDKVVKKLSTEISNINDEEKDFLNSVKAAREGVVGTTRQAKDAADDLAAANKSWTEIQNSKFDVVLKEKLKGIFADLPGLLAKIGAILGILMWRQLLKFDEEAVKTKRVIGQWADASALANTKFVTGTEVLKTMRDLGEQFHINPVQVFSSEELGSIAQAQKLTGMTAQAAGNLGVQSKIIGTNTNKYRDSIAAGANQANRLNHSAVNLSAVQNDVLNTSRAITLSYGKNVEGLAKAAGSAAALGMNLQQVEDISKNLMNFESSIEAEMQAQLLTGMQLNLAKAREYALNNDLNGVAQEISRQGMDAAKFSHMNYIQQENMAKALGMSREQMSKMLIMQEINRGLTAEQVAAMTGMRREDIEALSAQEKWQTMKQRFLESLVPLLEPILQVTSDVLRLVSPLVGFIGKIAGWISRIINIIPENNVVLRTLWTLALGIGTVITFNWLRGLRGAALLGTRLGGIFKGIGTGVVNIGKGIGNWITKLRGTSTASQAAESVFDKAANRWRDVKTGRFAKSPSPTAVASPAASTGTSALGDTVGTLGQNMSNILKGAAAAALISAALYGLAKACQEFENVGWKGALKAAAGTLALMGAVVLLGKISKNASKELLIGAGAMILVSGALWVLGKALQQFEGIEGIFGRIASIAGGLVILTTAVGLIGLVVGTGAGAVAILAGAAAIVLMSGALAILGAALRTMQGLNFKEMFVGFPGAMGRLVLGALAAVPAAAALMLAGPALLAGALTFIPAVAVLNLVAGLVSIGMEQLGKALKSVTIVSGEELVGVAAGIRAISGSVGELAVKLSGLSVRKLNALGRAFKKLKGAQIQIQTPVQETEEVVNRVSKAPENTGESKEIKRETIEAAAQNIVIKQAQVQASAQQISVEQKATDLSKIEQKIDKVIKAVVDSRPDWNWLEFNRAYSTNS